VTSRDLRYVFGSNDRSIVAHEAFTDRQAQWRAVHVALAEHARITRAAEFQVEDLEAPRENILVFHGVGGIGKTTLSRKLQAVLQHSEQRPQQWPEFIHPWDRLLPVRIDLARSGGSDIEGTVLAVRLAVAALGRPMPAFDLALRRYWEHNHPGEPIEEYLRRRGLFARFSAAAALPDQIQAALGDVAHALLLPGAVGTVLGQGTKVLVKALREHRQAVRALAGCSRLADLLEADPDLDTLSYLPHLLAWDLAQLPKDKQVLPVILLDTFEDIGDRTHRERERLLQRLVWLMPNAFFIVTGRDRLQWADPALEGRLDWTGRSAWPGLATDPETGHRRSAGSRQLLIGDFSPDDCRDYLAGCLTRDGHPLISPPVRDAIADASHGLPLYLDLSVMRFLELRRGGHQPRTEDFQHDFPTLIARTVRDLSAEERRVLRSVSLLDSFSVPLATHAAGLAHHAAAIRLIERPFIQDSGTGPWPFHLHTDIRSAIRSSDSSDDSSDDRWSPQDWRHAARRALQALSDQWSTDRSHDRALLLGYLRQGLTLAREFQLELGTLIDAAFQYVDDSIWEPLALPDAQAHTEGLTPVNALMETLSAIARRQRQHRLHTADRLTRVLDSGQLPPAADELARYYRAKASRDLGYFDASRQDLHRIRSAGGRLAASAGRGIAHLSRCAGEFQETLDLAEHMGWEGRHQRLIGDVWWAHGDMDRAAAAYLADRLEAEQHHSLAEAALAQAHLAFTTCFTDPAGGDAEIVLAEELLAGVSLRSAALAARIAALVRDAGRSEDLHDRADLLRAEIQASGLAYAATRLELALCFHHAIRDEPDRVTAHITRLRQLTGNGGSTAYVEAAHFMAGLPLPPDLRRTSWVDSEEATRGRWRSVVTNRQAPR